MGDTSQSQLRMRSRRRLARGFFFSTQCLVLRKELALEHGRGEPCGRARQRARIGRSHGSRARPSTSSPAHHALSSPFARARRASRAVLVAVTSKAPHVPRLRTRSRRRLARGFFFSTQCLVLRKELALEHGRGEPCGRARQRGGIGHSHGSRARPSTSSRRTTRSIHHSLELGARLRLPRGTARRPATPARCLWRGGGTSLC